MDKIEVVEEIPSEIGEVLEVTDYTEYNRVSITLAKDDGGEKLLMLRVSDDEGEPVAELSLADLYDALQEWMLNKRIACEGYPISEAAFVNLQEYNDWLVSTPYH